MRRLGLVLLLAISFGCGASGEPSAIADEPSPATYTVRGRVLEPWDGERLAVRHEAITDFRGVSDELEPMAEMSMRFPVAPDLEVGGISVGELITFELSVDWRRRPPHRIESYERLPAGTVLELSR